MMSLPVRERGLKLPVWAVDYCFRRSLPVRERGLKSMTIEDGAYILWVAPRAGAWIEIDILQKRGMAVFVAPRAGAWIEIFY